MAWTNALLFACAWVKKNNVEAESSGGIIQSSKTALLMTQEMMAKMQSVDRRHKSPLHWALPYYWQQLQTASLVPAD